MENIDIEPHYLLRISMEIMSSGMSITHTLIMSIVVHERRHVQFVELSICIIISGKSLIEIIGTVIRYVESIFFLFLKYNCAWPIFITRQPVELPLPQSLQTFLRLLGCWSVIFHPCHNPWNIFTIWHYFGLYSHHLLYQSGSFERSDWKFKSFDPMAEFLHSIYPIKDWYRP